MTCNWVVADLKSSSSLWGLPPGADSESFGEEDEILN